MGLAACGSPVFVPLTPQSSAWESPLIPGIDTPLSQNRWRITALMAQGEPLAFDRLAPVYITFAERGELVVYTANCNAWGNIIKAEGAHRYQLLVGESTAVTCLPAAAEQQEHNLGTAIRQTTTYTITGNQLVLSGDQVQVTLEVDNP